MASEYIKCEFCGNEIREEGGFFRSDITLTPFHNECFKKAIKTLAEYSKSLEPKSRTIPTDINQYMIIRDPKVTNGPKPSTIFSSYAQAKVVAKKMCEENKCSYYIVALESIVEYIG